MLYDLNVPWSANTPAATLERTISFLSEVGYDVVALNHHLNSPLPPQLSNPIPSLENLSIKIPPKTVLLRRCTLSIADPSQNHRLANLAPLYDILALRPTTENAFLAATQSLSEHSIISLDLTQRYPFHFKPKPLMTAVNRGIFIELCYSQAVGGESAARKNVISNVMAIVRATRGRGLIISSEARSVLGVRGPADVVNLLGVWGLSRERGNEALSINPRAVVVNEKLKRTGYRGIVDVVESGAQFMPKKESKKPEVKDARELKKGQAKRPSEDTAQPGAPMSKRAAKRAKVQALREAKEHTVASSSMSDISMTSMPPEIPLNSNQSNT